MKETASELSRIIKTDEIKSKPKFLTVEASNEECEAVAPRLELQKLQSLTADLKISHGPGGYISLIGELSADVTQRCVVTMESFRTEVVEAIELYFSEEQRHSEDEMVFDQNSPEPVNGGVIDYGECVVQQLSLSLDPYPRAPGVVVAEGTNVSDEAEMQNVNSPFKDLAGRLSARTKRHNDVE